MVSVAVALTLHRSAATLRFPRRQRVVHNGRFPTHHRRARRCWTSLPATAAAIAAGALAEAEFQHDLRPEDIERTSAAAGTAGSAQACAPPRP